MTDPSPQWPALSAWFRPSVLVLVMLLLSTGACDSDEDERFDALRQALQTGSDASSFSVRDGQSAGGTVLSAEAHYDGTVPEVRDAVGDRLRTAGYTLRCPAGDDPATPDAPDGQSGIAGPREACAVEGAGVTGTVWLGTVWLGTDSARTVKVSALAGG